MALFFRRFSSFLLISAFSAALLSPIVLARIDRAASFERKSHPAFNTQLFEWPISEFSAHSSANLPFAPVECYTQLDRSFISTDVDLRLNNSMTLPHRPCLLRIPTGTRLTVTDVHMTNRKTYATVFAGVSYYEMPMRTAYIRRNQKENYGPWHVPCQQAYLVLNSRGHELEWVEFRLENETKEDRDTSDPDECFANDSE